MAKIEFIEQIDSDNIPYYYTEIDGQYVRGSVSIHKNVGYARFQDIVQNILPVKTILETEER